jgi:hypothetical protein
MLAYGFKTEVLVELVNAELATSTIERMVIGGLLSSRRGLRGEQFYTDASCPIRYRTNRVGDRWLRSSSWSRSAK